MPASPFLQQPGDYGNIFQSRYLMLAVGTVGIGHRKIENFMPGLIFFWILNFQEFATLFGPSSFHHCREPVDNHVKKTAYY